MPAEARDVWSTLGFKVVKDSPGPEEGGSDVKQRSCMVVKNCGYEESNKSPDPKTQPGQAPPEKFDAEEEFEKALKNKRESNAELEHDLHMRHVGDLTAGCQWVGPFCQRGHNFCTPVLQENCVVKLAIGDGAEPEPWGEPSLERLTARFDNVPEGHGLATEGMPPRYHIFETDAPGDVESQMDYQHDAIALAIINGEKWPGREPAESEVILPEISEQGGSNQPQEPETPQRKKGKEPWWERPIGGPKLFTASMAIAKMKDQKGK